MKRQSFCFRACYRLLLPLALVLAVGVSRGGPEVHPLLIDEHRVLVTAPTEMAFKHLSWPKIACTAKGTLVLAYSAGIGHNIGASGLAVSVSSDGGKSFSPPSMLKIFPADDGRYRDCGNLAIGIAGDGAVVVLAMAYHDNARNTVFGYRSGDEGQTWEAVDTTALSENKTGSVYGHVLTLPDGRLAVSGHYRAGSSPHTQGIWLSYSGDDGRTWGTHERIIEKAAVEPAIVYTQRGFVGLLRSWGGRPDYSLAIGIEGEAWRVSENALGLDLPKHFNYPSPFLVVDPAYPERLWALKSFRGSSATWLPGGIVLWTVDLKENEGLHDLKWRRVGQLVKWDEKDGENHTDFTYPWMSPLGGDRWIMVYYSGNKKGSSAIYGLTLRLDPKTGRAFAHSCMLEE
jgi:hypothetical protein